MSMILSCSDLHDTLGGLESYWIYSSDSFNSNKSRVGKKTPLDPEIA